MRLKTFKHLALASALTAVLAACGGGSGSDPMATANQVNDTELAWVDQPASIKWDGADAEAAAELKERRRNRDGRRGNGNSNSGSNDNSNSNSNSNTTTTSDSNSTTSDSAADRSDSGSTSDRTSDDSADNGSGSGSDSTDNTTNADGSDTADNSHSDEDSTADNDADSDNRYAAPGASGDYGAPAGAAAGSYGAVTFDEEWNGSLDSSKWHTRMPHWNESIPDLDNWKIENGQLKMWTPKMENGQFLYENRAFTTHERFNQRYGWFEMEARLPPGQGMWPSFWLYGIYGTDRPEIDIMESHGGVDAWWGDPNPIDYGATVWLGQLDGNHERVGMVRPTHFGLTPGDLTTGFHKYGTLWEPDGITFYLDGEPIGDKIYTSRMNREMWLIVGLGTGRPGDYNGPTSRTPTNSEFVINYVRAWALPGGQTTVNGRSVD